MQVRFLSFLVLIFFFSISSFSQVTNTKKWRKTENDSMQRALLLYDEGNYLMALPIYEKLFYSHPKEDYLKYCYSKCALERSDKHEDALKLLGEVYDKNKKVEDIEYDLARANHYNYKFDEAMALIEKCLINKRVTAEVKTKAQQLKKYCIYAKEFYAKPTDAKVTNSGNVLNTEDKEYVPVISADESVMIFTYEGKESMGGLQNAFVQPDLYGKYFEDVFISYKENDLWTRPRPITTINTNGYDAAIALSVDGQTLFTYKDDGDDHGDIYVSSLIDTTWSVPQKIKGQVNSYSWEGSCSMTADGRYLYFSSERGGGYGGRDIYRAALMADSTWGNVVNLGDSINTALDDDAPFIHPDGITLYYSSKGKNSMGDYDVFQAKMNWLDSTFYSPVNLGYPINTPDNDRYYVLSANGETGYYSSGKRGGVGLQDIYTVSPGYVGKKPSLMIVKGKLTNDSINVEGNILVEIISNNADIKYGDFKSNGMNGNYLVSLPEGAQFKLTYTYKDYAAKTLTVTTEALEGYVEKVFDVNFNQKPDTAKPVVLVEPKKDTGVAIKQPEPQKTDFKPTTPVQQKVEAYAQSYGDIKAEGLIFKVQIAAYKYPKNYVYKHLEGLGAVENLLLDDGITRITIGGSFETLNTAFIHNIKVIKAGQKDAFVTAIYNGKRVYLEDLERLGIFPKK